MVGAPFSFLQADEFGGDGSEAGLHHFITLQFFQGFTQALRQNLHPPGHQLFIRDLVHIPADIRLAWVDLLANAIHTGRDEGGNAEVGIVGGGDGAVLEAARCGVAEHLGAVVVPVGDEGRCPGVAGAAADQRRAHLEPLIAVNGRRGDGAQRARVAESPR